MDAPMARKINAGIRNRSDLFTNRVESYTHVALMRHQPTKAIAAVLMRMRASVPLADVSSASTPRPETPRIAIVGSGIASKVTNGMRNR